MNDADSHTPVTSERPAGSRVAAADRSPHARRLAPGALLALALMLTLPFLRQAGGAGAGAPAQVTPPPPCVAGGSALVAACLSEFRVIANGSWAATRLAQAPAVVAVRIGPGAPAEHRLATLVDTGSVWGLATVETAPVVYAAAFQTRGQPFLRAGPGAVYRLDLVTGAVDLWATVPDAGGETHSDGPDLDEPARNWAGKSSLGDADVSPNGRELAVVNLADRRIYRFAVPGGELLGSFAHGAAGEAWAADARPFGLAYHGGKLYHGVVNSAESTQDASQLAAYVYESAPDGSGLRRVLGLPLGYPRGEARLAGLAGGDPLARVALAWRPWRDGYNVVAPAQQAVYPQPILADIAFDHLGNMLLGLRDRQADMTLGRQQDYQTYIEKPGLGIGDLILARPVGDQWQPVPPANDPADPYHDRTVVAESSVAGGLAWLPRLGQLVAGSVLPREGAEAANGRVGAALTWFQAPDGARLTRLDLSCSFRFPMPTSVPLLGERLLGGVALADDEWKPVADLGDVEEAWCEVPPTLTPTPTTTPGPSPTRSDTPPPSSSPSPTPSATAPPPPSATPRPTPTRGPAILPLALREQCTERRHADVVLVLDASTSMLGLTAAGRTKIAAARDAARQFVALLDPAHDQAAVAWFNAAAGLAQPLTNDPAALAAALDGIQVQELTRIHLGLAAARRALAGAERRAANAAVVILLTDGRASPDPVQLAVDEAAALKAAGATVFTIGLGRDLDEDALARMASGPSAFRRAGDAEELAAIYRQIARDLPCPRDRFWPWPSPGGTAGIRGGRP